MSKVLALLLLCAFASAQVSPSNTIVQNAEQVPQLSTLVTVLSLPAYAPILNALNSPGNFTVFAPTNDAFTAAGLDPSQVQLVTDILLYHVLGVVVFSKDLKALQFPSSLLTDSAYVTLGGAAQVLEVQKSRSSVTITFGIPGAKNTTATVLIADVQCSNGVVHVIDRVLIFPARTSAVASGAGLDALVAAVVSVNLVKVVDNTSSLTIFAPTDAAFSKVGPVDPKVLTQILEYHVVPAVAFSNQLYDGEVIPTLNGNTLTVSFDDDGIYINDAKVLIPNVLTANGVVHVIDSVLIPPTTHMPKHPHYPLRTKRPTKH
jgi:uncharacterized surface protein with fasciclin (FAS1) repeats